MPAPAPATGGETTPFVNPLAALNQAAYDAEHADAVNSTIHALAERIGALRGDLDAAVREAGEDWDVSRIRTLRGDTDIATQGNLVDHHSRLTAAQEVLNQRRAIQAAAMRRARSEGRHEDDHGDLLEYLEASGPARPASLVESLRAAMTERGVDSYRAAGEHRMGFEMDLGSRPLAATLERGTIGPDGNTWNQSAGFPPWSDRSGRVVTLGRAALTYLDVVPMGSISQAAHIYERETEPITSTSDAASQSTDAATAASAAATRVENTALAESTFLWARVSDPVQSIGHYVPVTIEQLEDAPRVESLLEGRMLFGVRQRMNIQIGAGDGAAPNIKGFSYFRYAPDTTSADSRLASEIGDFVNQPVDISAADDGPKRGKAIMTGARRLMTKIEVEGASMPTALVLHPATWAEVSLTESMAGGFYFGDPRVMSGMSLWGLPVVYDQYAMREFGVNRQGAPDDLVGLMGDFAMQSEFLLRHDVRVEFGMNDSDFRNLRQSVRAYVRGCLSIYRIKAFGNLQLVA